MSGSSGRGEGKRSAEQAAASYNPYAGLAATFDPQAAASTYTLPESPQFLFNEEANVERRTMSENLTFCSGVGYGGGALVGGLVGGARALRNLYGSGALPASDANASGSTSSSSSAGATSQQQPLSRKLLTNRLLNEGGTVGRRAGNAAGSVGLFYAVFDSGLGMLRDRHDNLNCIAAGALSAALFRAPHGARPAAVFAASGAAIAAACVGTRSLLSL